MGIFRNGELSTEQIGMLMAGVPIEELPKQEAQVQGSAVPADDGKEDSVHE